MEIGNSVDAHCSIALLRLTCSLLNPFYLLIRIQFNPCSKNKLEPFNVTFQTKHEVEFLVAFYHNFVLVDNFDLLCNLKKLQTFLVFSVFPAPDSPVIRID